MGYLIAVIVGLFLLYLAIGVLVAAFLLFILPAFVVVLPLAALGGAVVAVVVVVRALAGVGGNRPRTITPRDVRDGTAGLPASRDDRPYGRDPAWPSYPVAQSRVDLHTAGRGVLDVVHGGFTAIGGFTTEPFLRGLRIAGGLVAFVLWLAVAVGAVGAAGALLGLCWIVRTAAWLGWLGTVGALRAADSLVRRGRRAQASCPRCYHVSPVPAFACGGCGRVHHDIRPGRLGAIWRRCECGERLPTTVLGASARLEPACQRCGLPLRVGAAVLTDIRLPVFGPVYAGKTRLLYAGLTALRETAAARGAELDFVDPDSQEAADNGRQIITSGADTVKTPAGLLPSALTVRLTTGKRRALLHLFDAAGEFYADREDNGELEFLDHAQGLVFVLDPFSLPWVRDQLGDTGPAGRDAGPTAQEPEAVYQVTARRLRDYGVDTRQRALAVIVVKADLLAGLPPAAGLRADRVRDWLVTAGMDNLVTAAERDFGAVRYFLVASVPADTAAPDLSPAAPFDWLITRAGLSLAATEGA